MSEKRYASYYGKYDSGTSTLPFGTTVNDGSTSIKSSLPNMIQTSIIPQNLGGDTNKPNSIQQTTIITSDSKFGTYSSNAYVANALNGSTANVSSTSNVSLNYDFNTSSSVSRVFKLSSDILIVAKIDTSTPDGNPDKIYTKSFKFDACVVRAQSDLNTVAPDGTAASRILFPVWTVLGKTTGTDTYISDSAMSASITEGTLTFTFTATVANINYSYDSLIKTDIISMDIN